jgi:NADH-quinone oxidoreductase subunit N
MAKFYMLKAALATPGSLWLVIFAVVMAAVSVYYYFRVIQAMYFKEPGETPHPEFPAFFKGVLAAIVLLVILLGIYPELLLGRLYF